MNLRNRAFWIPAIVGSGILVASQAGLFFYLLTITSAGPHGPTSFRLVPFALLILTGAVSALLAWRMGAQRWVRMAAGISPAVLVLCFALYYFLSLRGITHRPVALTLSAAARSAWMAVLYLLLGTLPFLLPSERARPNIRT